MLCADDDSKWQADCQRESAGIDFQAMCPTPIQRIYNIAGRRSKWEKLKKDTSALSIFQDYNKNVSFAQQGRGNQNGFNMSLVQVALSRWDNLLSKELFRTVLLKHESMDTWVWDSIFKLEAIVRKVVRQRAEDTTLWLLHALPFKVQHCGKTIGELSGNELTGKKK